MALHSRRSFLALLGATGCAGVASADGTTTTATNATATTGSGTTPSSTEAETSPTETPDEDETPPVGDVRMDGVTPARTGHDPDAKGPGGPVQRQWCVGSGGSNRLTPLAVVDGTVFSGSPARGVRAFDARTGETEWRARLDQYPSAPTVVGDRVYTTDAVAAYALGVESGRELWSTRLADGNGRVTTSPLVASVGGDDVAFVGALERADDGETERGYVAAIDAADGSVRWRAETAGGNVYESLAARDGIVYGGGTGHYFYAFDAATGERRWRAELGAHATSPAVGPESVVVGDESGAVHARDRTDGAERWTYETGAEIRASPAVADGTAYVAATDGDLYALDARTGDLRWRFDGGRRLTEAPTVVGSDEDATVFVGSAQGNVFAVDAATGAPRWSHQFADGVETPPVAVGGFVFVGDGEGHVYALVDESASVPAGARECDAGRTPTPTPEPETRDADGDGVPDRRDYAPRDASVQRRGDLASGEGDDDFLVGAAVGAAATTVGIASGWWMKGRTDDE